MAQMNTILTFYFISFSCSPFPEVHLLNTAKECGARQKLHAIHSSNRKTLLLQNVLKNNTRLLQIVLKSTQGCSY
jgi:hypothetical protein